MSQKKTKVLVVSDYFYPHWTGISKSIFNLTKILQERINFTVLTVNYSGKLKSYEKNKKVTIIREPFLFSFSRVKYSPSLVLKFFRIVGQFDVILINSPCANILPISIITKIYNRKLLIFHQGDLVLPNGPSNCLIERIFDLSTIISFYLSNKVSSYTKDYAKNSRVLKPFISKFTPILPIFLNRNPNIKLLPQLIELRKQNKILFGFGGRFVEEKGFDILFKAVPLVTEKLSNAHFVFAGEIKIAYEDFFEKIKPLYNKIQNNITMTGLLDDKDINYFYNTIDYVLIPSRSDCFPLFQAEAMLSGKPAVVSDIPGARYLVKKTGFGLVFEKENPSDLASKILELVKEGNKIKNNYQKVLEILDAKKNAEKIRNFIEK